MTEIIASQMQSGQEESEYKKDLSLMLSSSECSPSDVGFTVGPREENTMSSHQLMEGIMENLKRDLDKCSSISLSMTTAATIAAAAVSQQKEGQHETKSKEE